MDIYTTSFCLPRNLGSVPASLVTPSPTSITHPTTPAGSSDSRSLSPAASFDRTHSRAASLDEPGHHRTATEPLATGPSNGPAGPAAARNRVRTDSSSARRQAHAQSAAAAAQAQAAAKRPGSDDVTGDVMQKLCVEAMAAHQCLVSTSRVGGTDGTGGENVAFVPRRPHPAPNQMQHPVPGSATGSVGSLREFLQSDQIPSFEPGGGGPPGSATSLASVGTPVSSLGGVGSPGSTSSSLLPPLAPLPPLPDAPRGKGWNFHLSGGYQQVMSARGQVLRDSPFKRKSVVKVPRAEVLDVKENVRGEMKRKLDEIAGLTRAHLAIVGQAQGPAVGFGLETERNVEIVITGGYESVEQARVRLLVLLDELAGLHSEICEIDYKLHNIIAGRKRSVVQTIQEETATNIYFPTPFSGILGGPGGGRNVGLTAKQNLIFVTGEFFGVQRARDMLFQVSMHKSKCIISRDTAILPRKLDWMLTDRLDDLKTYMNDNGTFINFPTIGSQASLVSVYGDHRVNIERTIRSVMQLACQFYVASFWLLPVTFDVFMPPPTIQPSQVPPVLKHIAATTGAEAVFKSNCFELHGTESEVRSAVAMVLQLELVRPFHHEIRFQIELANEHREFISGKKNGKLNKIMKAANVKIKFETFNDYNFLIDVAGTDEGALAGLTLLQEELPAEISFHIPEGYHKRIIGVGGKNIQRIMKKYGVYVKFSNAEDHAQLGGYVDNEDNVVARTPAKNAMNLDNLKQSVMEMVHPRDKDFVVETVSIPRRYHRTLLGEKSIFIHDIEAKTNSVIRFPNKENASDIVVIFGPESQVHIAAQMLLVHIAFEAEYRLPHSAEMASLVLSPEWVGMAERVKRDLNITILPFVDRSGAADETTVKFCLNRSNVDFLGPARDIVEDFLVSRKISLYPGSLRPRADSFADAFPYFNSKLLSTGETSEQQQAARPTEQKSKDLKAIGSTSDIKALFDGPSYIHQTGHDREASAGSGFPPVMGAGSGDYSQWSAPRPVSSYASQVAFPSSNAPAYSPTSYTHHPPSRLSAEETALSKRASDHQLEEKMRRSTPRSFVPRAQSLDMGRFDINVPSTGPGSFRSSGVPTSSATLPRSHLHDRTNTEDITRVFSNLGLDN